MSVDINNKCPNCGAHLSGLELRCPECGYVLVYETAGGKNTTEFLASLQEKLSAVDKVFTPGISASRRKATLINASPIPNTTDALIRLLHFSYANFEAVKESGDKRLAMAWLGKAVEAYRRLEEYNSDDAVATALKQYNALGEKRAFEKLSGSARRRGWIILACTLIVASLAGFILWYDWAGLLISKGEDAIAVRLLQLLGRDQEAVQKLVDAGRLEAAAELLNSRGCPIESVSLLAKNGMIMDALLMIGRQDSANVIHSCVDEIGKYVRLGQREKHYLANNYILAEDDEMLVKVYENNPFKISERFSLKSKRVVWYDFWNINLYIVVPQPHFLRDSFFSSVYTSETLGPQDGEVVFECDDKYRLTYCKFPKLDWEFYFDYTLSYLLAERGFYSGKPIYKTEYDYNLSGQIESVHKKYLLNSQEFEDLLGKPINANELGYDKQSLKYHYSYENGNLKTVSKCYDIHVGYVSYKYVFDYSNKLRIISQYANKKRYLDDPDDFVKENTCAITYSINNTSVESFQIEL